MWRYWGENDAPGMLIWLCFRWRRREVLGLPAQLALLPVSVARSIVSPSSVAEALSRGGQTILHYRVLEELGSGGMGQWLTRPRIRCSVA